MSLEMSQKSELTTGARGVDARSRHGQAGETPPMWCPLTTRHLLSRCSDRCRSHRSQTCDGKQPRGDWRHEPRDLDGKEGPRSTTPVTTCRRRPEALGYKASPCEWCPQGCGPSASHGRAGTRTQKQQRPIHTQQVEKGRSSEDRARVTTHSECGDERGGSK